MNSILKKATTCKIRKTGIKTSKVRRKWGKDGKIILNWYEISKITRKQCKSRMQK